MRIFRKITFTDAGSAAVEFALILPMIMLLVAGLLDYGNVMTIRTRVNSAARAAAQYAARYPADTAGITAAGTAATTDTMFIDIPSLVPAAARPSTGLGAGPYLFCTCGPWGVAGTTVLSPPPQNCWTQNCSSGPIILKPGNIVQHNKYYYVAISFTENYTPLLPYMGLGAPIAITGAAAMQVQ